MLEVQKCYQGPADTKQSLASDFKVGDQVYLKAKYLRSTRPFKKLSEKYLGPFMIISEPGTHSFTLQLPDSMHSVHPVFYISQLEPCAPNTIPNHVQPPAPLIKVDREPKYEIKEILDSKIDWRRCHCQLLYLVHWLGYQGTDDETSWLLAMELGNAKELVADFHQGYPNKPRPLPS